MTRRFNPSLHPRDEDGRWAEKAASRIGGGRGGRPEQPKLNVLPRMAAHPFGSGWQENPDPEYRAIALWAESHAGHQAVKKAMDNIAAGRQWDEGINFDHGRFMLTYRRIEDEHGEPDRVYNRDDLRADILSAAIEMQRLIDNPTTHKKPLYRGVRMNRDSIPKEGETFEVPQASWTEDKDWAGYFANLEVDSTGHLGDSSVVFRMTGQKRTTDIDQTVQSVGIQSGGEHLGSGRFRVKKVRGRGRRWSVQDEPVHDDPAPAPRKWSEQVSDRAAKPEPLAGPGWGERFNDQIKLQYPDVKAFISGGGNKPVIVHQIVVPKSERGKGTGGKIMRELLEVADRNGDTVALTPSDSFGGSVTKLKRWYASLGFVFNKGRAKDYEISEDMYRLPR